MIDSSNVLYSIVGIRNNYLEDGFWASADWIKQLQRTQPVALYCVLYMYWWWLDWLVFMSNLHDTVLLLY